MMLHPAKTKCMLLGSKCKMRSTQSPNIKLELDEVIIENVSFQKVLGIYVDNTLSWNIQLKKICSKLNSKIALLKRISTYLTHDMKLMYYNAYIMSTFDYCCSIWGKGTYIEAAISKMQKRAARIILNKPLRTNSVEMFAELQWLPFTKRYDYHVALLVYKCINNSAPKYITNHLTFSKNSAYSL